MEAIKFFETVQRAMGDSWSCGNCPVFPYCKKRFFYDSDCVFLENTSRKDLEEIVGLVEKWDREHSITGN